MAHTPGPWRIAAAGPRVASIPVVAAANQKRGHDSDTAAVVVAAVRTKFGSFRVTERTHSEGVANAQLIAAAPDLLDALQNAVALWSFSSTDAVQQVWLDAARTAIAKAEGTA